MSAPQHATAGRSGDLNRNDSGGLVPNTTRDARHATDVVRAVCDVLPGDLTAALVAVLIADDADASAATLGRLLHKDAATVRRARKRLADVDLIRAHTFVSDVSARASASVSDVSARVEPRVRAGDPCSSVVSSLFPTVTASADADAPNLAVDATKLVWMRKDPKPAIGFKRCLPVARSLLDAGWSFDDVVAAMCGAPTITTSTCEYWLNTQRRTLPSNAAREDAERRARPSRVITF